MKTIEKDSAGNTIKETVSSEQQNSIEISTNAKGEVAWKVKVYEDDEEKIMKSLNSYIRVAVSIVRDSNPKQ